MPVELLFEEEIGDLLNRFEGFCGFFSGNAEEVDFLMRAMLGNVEIMECAEVLVLDLEWGHKSTMAIRWLVRRVARISRSSLLEATEMIGPESIFKIINFIIG